MGDIVHITSTSSCQLGWFGALCFEVLQYYVAFRKPRQPAWLQRPGAWVTSVAMVTIGGPATFLLVQLRTGLTDTPYPFLLGFVWPSVLTLLGRSMLKLQELRKIKLITEVDDV